MLNNLKASILMIYNSRKRAEETFQQCVLEIYLFPVSKQFL